MAPRKGGLGSRASKSGSGSVVERTLSLLPTDDAPEAASGKPKHSRNVYMHTDTYEALRLLAFQEKVSQHALIMEGLARVFQAHGVEVPESIREHLPDDGLKA